MGGLVWAIYLIVTAGLLGRPVGRVEVIFGGSVAVLLVIFIKMVHWRSFRNR
jgi:hypothetical protein